MWMMLGCSAGDCRNPNIHNNRDLPDYSIRASNPQPAILLIPKCTSTSNTTEIPVSPFNHHQHQMVRVTSAEPGRSNGGCFYKQPAAAAPSRSSRWNPTPEQLMILDKLYRTGLKTPTAQQIRQVTVHLRNYGKIEGKNVFYWFQNHRARERQKRRRELMAIYQSDCKQQQQSLTNNTVSGLEDKESAGELTKLSLEVEQQKKWNLPKCTVLSDQDSSSVLQERMVRMVKSDSTRPLVEQPDSPSPTSHSNGSAATFSYTKFLDIPHYYDYDCGKAPNICKREEVESRETQTLELFPLESENLKGANDTIDTRLCISTTASTDDATADFMAYRSISISLNI